MSSELFFDLAPPARASADVEGTPNESNKVPEKRRQADTALADLRLFFNIRMQVRETSRAGYLLRAIMLLLLTSGSNISEQQLTEQKLSRKMIEVARLEAEAAFTRLSSCSNKLQKLLLKPRDPSIMDEAQTLLKQIEAYKAELSAMNRWSDTDAAPTIESVQDALRQHILEYSHRVSRARSTSDRTLHKNWFASYLLITIQKPPFGISTVKSQADAIQHARIQLATCEPMLRNILNLSSGRLCLQKITQIRKFEFLEQNVSMLLKKVSDSTTSGPVSPYIDSPITVSTIEAPYDHLPSFAPQLDVVIEQHQHQHQQQQQQPQTVEMSRESMEQAVDDVLQLANLGAMETDEPDSLSNRSPLQDSPRSSSATTELWDMKMLTDDLTPPVSSHDSFPPTGSGSVFDSRSSTFVLNIDSLKLYPAQGREGTELLIHFTNTEPGDVNCENACFTFGQNKTRFTEVALNTDSNVHIVSCCAPMGEGSVQVCLARLDGRPLSLPATFTYINRKHDRDNSDDYQPPRYADDDDDETDRFFGYDQINGASMVSAIRRVVHSELDYAISRSSKRTKSATDSVDMALKNHEHGENADVCMHDILRGLFLVNENNTRMDKIYLQLLFLAAGLGYCKTTQLLLDGGVGPNGCISAGSPLHAACYTGNEQTASLLIDHGANILAEDANHRIPLEVAMSQRHKKLLKQLYPRFLYMKSQLDEARPSLLARVNEEEVAQSLSKLSIIEQSDTFSVLTDQSAMEELFDDDDTDNDELDMSECYEDFTFELPSSTRTSRRTSSFQPSPELSLRIPAAGQVNSHTITS